MTDVTLFLPKELKRVILKFKYSDPRLCYQLDAKLTGLTRGGTSHVSAENAMTQLESLGFSLVANNRDYRRVEVGVNYYRHGYIFMRDGIADADSAKLFHNMCTNKAWKIEPTQGSSLQEDLLNLNCSWCALSGPGEYSSLIFMDK